MIKALSASSLVFILFIFLVLPVATADEQVKNSEEMSAEDQDSKAMEVFRKVRELMENSDRMTVLSEIEASYMEIITRYPGALISQETYWRLLMVYLTDYTPPVFDKAEGLYAEFIRKYPDSNMKNLIDDTLSNSYYSNAKWEKLLRFLTPRVKVFIETGKLSRPVDMFMYSEAKKNRGDLAEAEKGFKIVIALFPDSKEGALSKERLEEIKKIRSKTN